MSTQVELWRVTTPEGTFEADLETLKQWIAEGAVIGTDKVSKGNLNWIEAGRAPMLRVAFLDKAGNVAPPVTTAPKAEWTEPPIAGNTSSPEASFSTPSDQRKISAPVSKPVSVPSNTCQNHPDISAHYICRLCAATFCETCPRLVNRIAICPACGDLCKPFQEIRSKFVRQEHQGSGFGFSDFGRALSYPWQHKVALLCGAAMYGFLLLGGLKGQVIAFVIMFGCISQVISQVAWGRLNRSFMPDFSAFNLWDDFAIPLGLGFGIVIVTWGPMILLILVLFFGVFGGGHSPSTALPGGAAQSAAPNEKDLSALTDPNANAKQLEEADRKLQETRPGSVISREAENSKQQQNDPAAPIRLLLPYLGASILIVLFFFAFLLWGIFYGPMALTVAGYTQNFGSVINPLVGLDTIRRMGATYFKAFGMVLLLQAVSLIVAVIVAVVTAQFALPFVGNLPAKFIDGSITFYFNLVIACLLGLSLYKCADRVGITVD